MTALPLQHAPATQPPISFDAVLQATPMPDPGPEYYAARRKLWLTPLDAACSSARMAANSQKIESLLSHEDKLYSVQAWRSISSGQRLKRNLPLPVLIKITHAAWLRDNTWPAGIVAPDSDEEQAANPDAMAGSSSQAGA
ncbi:hypothetical protein BDN70DRAFT_991561 [Pholiota conissans]|uniref:Uncharacterized protein n=1 Tax=Pholiota conissans TaxID=109636 RepID=A0A9P5Z6B7_9AGAR|nr:hypothetical protein BDN70DRAFT_991561 [Pholiota conissans]